MKGHCKFSLFHIKSILVVNGHEPVDRPQPYKIAVSVILGFDPE